MNKYISSLQKHLFKDLLEHMRNVNIKAFEINQGHDFNYRIFSLGRLAMNYLDVGPEHLFPETKKYLDSQYSPELHQRVKDMDIIMSGLSGVSLNLFSDVSIMALLPAGVCQVWGITSVAETSIGIDLQYIQQAKLQPWYPLFLTHCLFVEMGIT